jgi:Tfp pilus assembly protein PilX
MRIRSNHRARQKERGIVTIILITLLAIMLILSMAEARALYLLHDNLRLLERQQIRRLNTSQTNAPAAPPSPGNP